MNRRAFLERLGFGTVAAAAAAAATGVLDIERLLWIPGEKTIFLPTVETTDVAWVDALMRKDLRLLKDRLSLATHFNRAYDQSFTVGQTVNVRLPRRFH